jgi:DNA-binding MarR family transcriptional regulator
MAGLYDKRRVWRNVPIRTSIIDKQEHIEQAARALKSISHPLRLKILCVIGDQDACVQEIVDAVGTSQSNISQHLAILREKGVCWRARTPTGFTIALATPARCS